MHLFSIASIFSLAAGVFAQSSAFCDSTNGVCYQRYYDAAHDLQYSLVFPPATPVSTEFMGEMVAPRTVGWMGFSFSGSMRNSLLLVAWPNGNQVVHSTRYIQDWVQPLPYAGPVITQLAGTGVNSTHMKLSFRCQNCTTWLNGQVAFPGLMGYAAHMSTPVNNPSDPNSNFAEHSTFGLFYMLSDQAQTSLYSTYLANNLPVTTTSITSSTPTTSSRTTSSAAPTGTGICTNAANPRYPLNVLSGYTAGTVLGGLARPRGIAFDTSGNLLVIDSGSGLKGYKLNANGCITSSSTIIADATLNHGIAFSPDGTTLFVSSPDILWSYSYNPSTLTATNQKVLIKGMYNTDHVTRTIVNPVKNPRLLVVSRGSDSNLDLPSYSSTAGRAIVKVFDYTIAPTGGYDYTTAGTVLGYGLRNEVGLLEDKAGGIWGIENSADNLYRVRNGVRTDVHQDNPGEKLNYLGNPATPSGSWFGYPYCFSVWDQSLFPGESLQTGQWFSQDQSVTVNGQAMTDAYCQTRAVKPTLVLQPHSAPLDIKFGPSGDTNMYASFHGSWNRVPPAGYSVGIIPGSFDSTGKWSPTASLASKTAATNLLWNTDVTQCNAGCFRPVGLAFHPTTGHLYVSSDTTGEIFIIKKNGGGTTSSLSTTRSTSTTSSTISRTSTSSTSSSTSSITSSTRSSTTSRISTSTTTSAGSTATAAPYGQCGGNNWTGPTACTPGWTCVRSDSWYSQCRPN